MWAMDWFMLDVKISPMCREWRRIRRERETNSGTILACDTFPGGGCIVGAVHLWLMKACTRWEERPSFSKHRHDAASQKATLKLIAVLHTASRQRCGADKLECWCNFTVAHITTEPRHGDPRGYTAVYCSSLYSQRGAILWSITVCFDCPRSLTV